MNVFSPHTLPVMIGLSLLLPLQAMHNNQDSCSNTKPQSCVQETPNKNVALSLQKLQEGQRIYRLLPGGVGFIQFSDGTIIPIIHKTEHTAEKNVTTITL